MSTINNKFLIVLPSVKLTPIIEAVIIGLEPYFASAGKTAVVTSGLRDAIDQLRVIRQYLTKKELDKIYPAAMTCQVTDMVDQEDYVWQTAWSHLLHIGVIINPPLAAKCLMDYFVGTKNRKGVLFNQTSHAKGTAFNIGGGGNGIEDEAIVIQKALDKKLEGLVSFVRERENNALHCNCKKVK